MQRDIFQRTELLLGTDALDFVATQKVILFGIGGVGSWCAESLVRSGVTHLTIVDCDKVNRSNINRQLVATVDTVGRAKVEVLKQRLLTINPDAEIIALNKMFCEDAAKDFKLESYDYVVDAIDSLRDKALLIEMACMTDATLFSSMGAALKLDPTRIGVTEFWKVKGDPLARALRQKFKRTKRFPKRKFKCVYSDELLTNKVVENPVAEDASPIFKAQTNGTLAHITAIFGFMLAGLVIQDVVRRSDLKQKNAQTS